MERTPEKIRRSHQTSADDEETQDAWVDLFGNAGRGIAADNGPHRHQQPQGPDNRPFEGEENDGDAVDRRGADIFDCVHAVQIAHAHDAEGGKHQNADARAKVAAIEGEEKLEDDAADIG